MSRFRTLSREVSWVAFGQVVSVLGTLVGLRLLTELLSIEAFGRLSLGLTIGTLINQTILGPLANGATRFHALAVERQALAGYVSAVRRLMGHAVRGIVVVAVAGAAVLVAIGRLEWLYMTVAATAFAVVSGINLILSGIQSAARQRAVVAVHSGAESWLRVLLAAALVILVGATGTIAIIGYAIASTLVLLSQWRYLHRSSKRSTDQGGDPHEWQRMIWGFAWPFSSWGLFSWAQSASDRWALALLGSPSDVGLYAALLQLGAYPIVMLSGIAAQLLAPIIYQKIGDSTDSRRNADVTRIGMRIAMSAVGLTVIAFILAITLHDWIFALAVGKEFRSVSYLLPWLVLASGAYATGQALALLLMARMKTREMVGVNIVTAAVGTVMNFAGAYWFGLPGLVFAAIAFSLMYLVWTAILTARLKGVISVERR